MPWKVSLDFGVLEKPKAKDTKFQRDSEKGLAL